ncbi:MAG: holo-ACP synthase [Puniceicoccales bacterium]|jgi:holo-[acyl-carrier protein] synthase|nr:holo-ACP synthase [Puniceicoccales bacterium]
MRVVGLGNDIIEIERVRRFVEKFTDRCIGRIYTLAEWHYCWNRGNPFASLAVRFAAKEAVLKALGVGIGASLSLTSVEVYNDALGAPGVRLDSKANALLSSKGGKQISIALSHCRTLASAVAVIV